MELKYKLLDHPFYQAWEMGEISNQQLYNYGHSYKDLISEIPSFWNKILTTFEINNDISNEIVNDETSHIALWDRWVEKNNDISDISGLKDVINTLNKMNPSELLGAIHSFELQQPSVAFSKKNGLMNKYGYNESDLVYFDEHFNEQKHIEFGLEVFQKYADKESFKNGFEYGSELFYNALDRFVN